MTDIFNDGPLSIVPLRRFDRIVSALAYQKTWRQDLIFDIVQCDTPETARQRYDCRFSEDAGEFCFLAREKKKRKKKSAKFKERGVSKNAGGENECGRVREGK